MKKFKLDLGTFCKNVIYLRDRDNLTKGEMASIMGISVKTLNQIERGYVSPRLSTDVLIHLVHHFHITPNMLFETQWHDV